MTEKPEFRLEPGLAPVAGFFAPLVPSGWQGGRKADEAISCPLVRRGRPPGPPAPHV